MGKYKYRFNSLGVLKDYSDFIQHEKAIKDFDKTKEMDERELERDKELERNV